MAWMMAAVAVGGSLLASATAPKDQSWKASARQQGKDKAAVTMQRAKAWEELAPKGKAVQEEAMLAEVQINMNAAAAEAAAEVSAAAAGVEGGSVDAVQMQIEANAAIATQNVWQQEDIALQQLEKEWEDIFWQADGQAYDLTHSGSAPNVLGNAAVAGISAYATARATANNGSTTAPPRTKGGR